jgi:hypothetical protein
MLILNFGILVFLIKSINSWKNIFNKLALFPGNFKVSLMRKKVSTQESCRLKIIKMLN